MRISIMDANTKKPLVNTKFQLQIKGQHSGILTVTTDQSGFITIDDQYMGHQLFGTFGGQTNPEGGKWLAAVEGCTLFVVREKAPATSGSQK